MTLSLSMSAFLDDPDHHPCQDATHIPAWWIPMERVMTLNLSRTSLTIILFWSGVERQHRTDRQYWVNSRNLFSRFPWKIAFSVFPSMTSPTSGARALELTVGMLDGMWHPQSFRAGCCGSWKLFTSSNAQLRMDSQVSCRESYSISEQPCMLKLYLYFCKIIIKLLPYRLFRNFSLSSLYISLQHLKQH